MWCRADRNGVLEDNPQLLRTSIFPYDTDLKNSDIKRLIDELCRFTDEDDETCWPMLLRIRSGRKKYLWAPKFQIHQKPHFRESVRHPLDIELINHVLDCFIEKGKTFEEIPEVVRAGPEKLKKSQGHYGLHIMGNEIWVTGYEVGSAQTTPIVDNSVDNSKNGSKTKNVRRASESKLESLMNKEPRK